MHAFRTSALIDFVFGCVYFSFYNYLASAVRNRVVRTAPAVPLSRPAFVSSKAGTWRVIVAGVGDVPPHRPRTDRTSMVAPFICSLVTREMSFAWLSYRCVALPLLARTVSCSRCCRFPFTRAGIYVRRLRVLFASVGHDFPSTALIVPQSAVFLFK